MLNSIYGSEPNPTETDKSFTIPLSDKLNVIFTAKDPFGFLEAKMSSGELPEEFQGAFTSPKEARSAVSKYMSNQSLAKKK